MFLSTVDQHLVQVRDTLLVACRGMLKQLRKLSQELSSKVCNSPHRQRSVHCTAFALNGQCLLAITPLLNVAFTAAPAGAPASAVAKAVAQVRELMFQIDSMEFSMVTSSAM